MRDNLNRHQPERIVSCSTRREGAAELYGDDTAITFNDDAACRYR